MEAYLPEIFLGLVGLAVFVYAVLDGFDLGVGILLPMHTDDLDHRDQFIASIGPFWDANETWLVLAVGLLFIAFPEAHNTVLRELYLVATLMLIGIIMRGVAFDFRAKAITTHRLAWDRVFKIGSIITALTQGYMLGRYVLGFADGLAAQLFSILSAFCVMGAYTFIGGAWLVMKTEGDIQKRSALITRKAAWATAIGVAAVSIVNPLISAEVAERWMSFPAVILLLPIPLLVTAVFVVVDRYLVGMPHHKDFGCWIPFVGAAMIFLMAFCGFGSG